MKSLPLPGKLILLFILDMFTGISGENELQLKAVTAKALGPGIARGADKFVGWSSSEAEIFWDIKFVSTGTLNVDIAYANSQSNANTKIQVKFGDKTSNDTIENYTEFSGGWNSVKVSRMGSVTVKKPGKFRLVLRALEMQGQACDLYYAVISGPGALNAEVVDVYPVDADSIHLSYPTDTDTLMFYNEIIVDESYPATFFMACGYQHGYFGIQEKDFTGYKIAIFSLWDVVDQEKINNDDLASVIRVGQNVTINRFGGEGTGYQSLYDFNWKNGEKHRFLLTAKSEGKYTIFTAYIYHPSYRQWKLMSSLRRLADTTTLYSFYSFIEDWLRVWGHIARQASFNPWQRNGNGQWVQIKEATFTKTGQNRNVNAWVDNGWFFMRTGGDTINTLRPYQKTTRTVSDQLPPELNNIDNIIAQELFIP